MSDETNRTVDVTLALATFAVTVDDLPEAVRHAGRRTLLNAVALGVGAHAHPAVDRLRAVLSGLGGVGSATLLGSGERLPAPWAALVNGAAIHVEDFDDTHLRTIVHPGAPVVPAALAAAELTGADDAALLDAVCVGVEVALRVARGMTPPHFDRGWHPTGTMGVIGAAAAAGRILALDIPAMQRALGLAATQSAGLLAALGTMTKSFHPGKAAANGLEAALLAARGFTAPMSIIEGRRGLAAVAGHGADLDVMVAGLGARWELQDNAFKPYACGIVSHPALDAARALAEMAGVGADWSSLALRVNPVVPQVMGVADPRDSLASKFSVYHCVALGLEGYAGGPESFTDAVATELRIDALRRIVTVETDPSIAKESCELRGRLADGTEHHIEIAAARGSVGRPMSDDELADKAHVVADAVLGAAGVDALVTWCLTIGSAPRPTAALVAAAVAD